MNHVKTLDTKAVLLCSPQTAGPAEAAGGGAPADTGGRRDTGEDEAGSKRSPVFPVYL